MGVTTPSPESQSLLAGNQRPTILLVPSSHLSSQQVFFLSFFLSFFFFWLFSATAPVGATSLLFLLPLQARVACFSVHAMVVLDGISSSGYTASSSSSRPSDSSERGPTTVLDSKFLVEKQKSPSHDSSSGGNGSSGGTEDRALLPPQIWHHIFTFCPPRSLGVLLSVNKLFNLYLDPASPVSREAPAADPFKSGALVPLKPNAIWQASRRLFWPIMPAPLQSRTELDMWRLACSNRCQICGKLDGRDSSSPFDVRNPGPGPDGVAALWAFGARMCASCLVENSTKVRPVKYSHQYLA